MLLHKSIEHDGRVQREARALVQTGYEVVIVHLPPPRSMSGGGRRDYRLLPATLPRWRRLPFKLHRIAEALNMVRLARNARPDAVHAHDAAMLVPGYLAARLAGASLIYDSHELATGVPYRSRPWALLVAAIERLIVPRCGVLITVSDGIADRLAERYALRDRPAVVRNVCDLPPPGAVDAADLRSELGVGNLPLVLHQGAVARDRGCETLIRAVGELDRAHLLFLGAEGEYAQQLQRLARRLAVGERVHFRPSVPLEALLSYTAQADVGVSLLEPTCENHRQALPNKVFEYLAAGIPIVVSDLPELRRFVRQHPVGFTADPRSPTAVAEAVERALAFRETGQASWETRPFRWEVEADKLRSVYGSRWMEESDGAAIRRGTERRGRERVATGAPALIIVRSTVTHNSRVLREARTLQDLGYRPHILGVVSEQVRERRATIQGFPVTRLSPSSPLSWVRKWLDRSRYTGAAGASPSSSAPRDSGAGPLMSIVIRAHRWFRTIDFYRRAVATVRALRPALVHCNDYNTMWVGVAARLLGRTAVVYDSHELWPDRNLRPEPRWWLLACEFLLVRCAHGTITASPGYAEIMARRYRIPPPKVVRNIPAEAPPNGPALGDITASPAAGEPIAVYAGALTTGRGLEVAIRALAQVHGARLRLVGPFRDHYRAELVELARREGVADRVELAGAVPPDRLLDAIREASVGLVLIQPVCLSYRMSLPNKLFEYVAAGIPVLGSDLPSIGRLINEHRIGLVAQPDQVSDVAAKLSAMLDPRRNDEFRRAVRAASERLRWESESQELVDSYIQAAAQARARMRP